MNSVTKENWARQNNEYDTVINGVMSTVRDTFLGNTVTVDENFLNNLKLIWESKLPLTHRKIDLEALEHETWPVEIWCKIFSYLPEKSTKNASLACRRWLKIIREDPKLSGHKLVSWDKTLEISQDTNWNWFNWPSLKTIEISYDTMPDNHVLRCWSANSAQEKVSEDHWNKVLDSLESIRLSFKKCSSLEKVILTVEFGLSHFLKRQKNNKLLALNPKESFVMRWNSFIVSLELLLNEVKNPSLLYEDTSLRKLLQIGQKTEENLHRLIVDDWSLGSLSKNEFENNFIRRLTNNIPNILPPFKYLSLDSDVEWKKDILNQLRNIMHENPKSNLFEILCSLLPEKLKSIESWVDTFVLQTNNLPDMKILIQDSWSDIWIIDFVYQMIHNELPNKIMVSGQMFELMPLVLLGDVSNLQDFDDLYSKLNDLKFDGIDHLLLVLLILLNEWLPNLRYRNRIRTKQNEYRDILQTYCVKRYPNVLDKFNQLLSVLPDIRKIAKCGEDFLFNKFKETNATTENLLYEIIHAKRTPL